MRELTQTVLASRENGWRGNCWMTAIACMLDLDPAVMPEQGDYGAYKANEDGTRGDYIGPDYYGPLQEYLREHHDLAYVELHEPGEVFPFLRVADPGWHLMTGLTPRSAAYGGLRHVVVGRYGECVWDPHPSRAGLIDEIRWAFLVPYPKSWRENEAMRAAQGKPPTPCVCPKCSTQFAVAS